MISRYTKQFILLIIFVGLLAAFSTIKTQKNQYKMLTLEAVLTDNIKATRFLIENGANVNAKYKHNHTLLHSAALFGDIKMVKLLVKNGAELLKNDFGLTAIDSAKENDEVKGYLVEHYDKLDKVYK